MAIRVIAQGTVLEAPAKIQSDREVVAFILGTHQEVTYRGLRAALDDVATCEIVCADELAVAAMRYAPGDQVLVSGLLRIESPAGALDDLESQYVRLEIHAEALGRS